MRKIENWELKEYTSKKCVDLGWFLPCYFCSYYNRKQEKCMCNTSPFFEKTVKYDEVNITKCPFFEMADGLIRDKNGRIRPDFNEYLKRQGPIIKQLRIQNNLTQKELADILHTSEEQIKKYETGAQTMNIEKYVLIALSFNVTLDYILGLIDEPHELEIKK